MAYKFFNPNPSNQRVGDCSVRAISKALNRDWEDVYLGLCSEGLIYNDMPSANYVWGMYLKKHGFTQEQLATICPDCTTVRQFSKKHPKGRHILACQNHVVASIDGNYYDTWDSGEEIVLYFFTQEES